MSAYDKSGAVNGKTFLIDVEPPKTMAFLHVLNGLKIFSRHVLLVANGKTLLLWNEVVRWAWC